MGVLELSNFFLKFNLRNMLILPAILISFDPFSNTPGELVVAKGNKLISQQ